MGTRHLFALLGACLLPLAARSYEVPIVDTDYSRQICTGMWGGDSTFINVTFDATSQGNVAMVIYEWADAQYLGKITASENDFLPKTYVCTSSAVLSGYCQESELGRFILDLPASVKEESTSFWSARVQLSETSSTESGSSSFWNNPEGNPPPPSDVNGTTNWRRDSINKSPDTTLKYTAPIQYLVRKTGYYCVAIIPVTVSSTKRQDSDTDVPYHPSYHGKVLFKNKFNGQLPASDYPKVNFYFAMFIVYAVFAAVWGWFCYRHVQDLLPIQYYLSGLVGLLVIEMVANWVYYRFLNAHGWGTASTVFLIVVAILDAGRNSMSFFMLLVVSLGLSVTRESLGKMMLKCQLLAGAHFVFGILYAIGIVELELESTSALILLLFVIPLAFTMSGFLLWIMYSLNATITELRARKQKYKLTMFTRLHRILIFTVIVIAIFFVVSTLSFSGRLAEDYAAKSWKVRWWLLDGWLALLYFVSFVAISYLWRPSDNNRRLAMSDELAQDEEDAEDYDMEALEHRSRLRGDDHDDDESTLVGDRRNNAPLHDDTVVFEIGDDDEAETPIHKKRRPERLSGEQDERQGLMGEGRNRDD
ncbi:hypothetical protein CYLTODRAFT_489174 [Cylindrobasidium torrendii FP15055 ss-10]|uniref:Integral membrane protein n=1 Tax=Cylindrobasidium torrendii FP15055 ss-10 TaxID=1314674 RepID=A0A0D7BF60_9AGAR|nr:hypothetical protein CYLTODRAFT_489174 [Cylindrobasidium torrendii FP15055 ss-10]